MEWCTLCQTNRCECDTDEINELKTMLRQFTPMVSTKISGVYEPRCVFCGESTHTENCKWLQKVGG